MEIGKPMGTVIFENAKFKKENAALTKSAADRLSNKVNWFLNYFYYYEYLNDDKKEPIQ